MRAKELGGKVSDKPRRLVCPIPSVLVDVEENFIRKKQQHSR